MALERLDLDKWHRDAEDYCSLFISLLRAGDESLQRIGELVKVKIKEHRERTTVSLAFVGQYSAGKSTIISALTGRDDIEIAAGVTTERCQTYEWQAAGILLVDTPGLYAGRDDHDQVTNEQIERSDLLAFCLTAALFDHITLRRFKELAAECRYWPKMILVVNKLLSEAGDPEERIGNYRSNLNEMLDNALLRSIPVVFVDAKLYREGSKLHNERLIDKSRFADLVVALNKLTQERDLLGRADTAIRHVLRGTNDAIIAISGGEESDKAFLHLLNRYLELVASSRKALRREFKDAANDAMRVVLEESDNLMAALNGSGQEQFEMAERQCHERVGERLRGIRGALQRKVLEVGASLERDVEEIQSLPLFEQFARRMSDGGGGVERVAGRLLRTPRLESQMGILQNVAYGLSGLLAFPGRGNAKKVPQVSQKAAGGIMTNSGAERSGRAGNAPDPVPNGGSGDLAITYFDDAVRTTVDHINSTFHLHLSSDSVIHATHSTHHFLQSVGPFLALGGAATAIWGLFEEKKRTDALGAVRQELQAKFTAAREQAYEHFEKQGAAFDTDVLIPLQKEILAKREAAEVEMASGNELVDRLRGLRAKLEASLGELAAMAW